MTILAMMERKDLLVAQEIVEIELRIARLTTLVQELKAERDYGPHPGLDARGRS